MSRVRPADQAAAEAEQLGIKVSDPFGVRGAVNARRGGGRSFAKRLAALKALPPLRQIILSNGYAAHEVAALAGVSLVTVSNLANGRYATVRIGELVAVGHAIGIAPAALIPGLEIRVRDAAADLAHLTVEERVAVCVTARLERERRERARSHGRKANGFEPQTHERPAG